MWLFGSTPQPDSFRFSGIVYTTLLYTSLRMNSYCEVVHLLFWSAILSSPAANRHELPGFMTPRLPRKQ